MCDVIIVDGALGEQGVQVPDGTVVVFIVGNNDDMIRPLDEVERIRTMAHELTLDPITDIVRLNSIEESIFEPTVLRIRDEPEFRNPMNPRQAARMNRPKRRKHKR